MQDHHRYDMADVAHMILKKHDQIDWKQLLSHMELYWEVLLMALLNFRFVYPSERHLVPRWIMDELMERLRDQYDVKGPGKKVCRGRIFSPRDYAIDVEQWGFSEAVGISKSNMASENGKLRVAAIGDLHVQENDSAPYREMFSEISGVADVLVLCGDLTNFGKTRKRTFSPRTSSPARSP